MPILVVLIIKGVLGTISALIAQSKGRSAVGWFFVGFLFGIIGLIIAAVMSDLKKEQEKEARLRRENRRLREQARKDRMVANKRHRELEQRVGAHDQVLGLDTKPRRADNLIDFDQDDELAEEPSSAFSR